jgi:hypothetical protein
MGAQRFLELNEPRLVEGADQAAGFRDRVLDCGAVPRIGPQISRTQVMGGE